MSKIDDMFKDKTVSQILETAKKQFISSAMSVHQLSEDEAKAYYEVEKMYFTQIVENDKSAIEYAKSKNPNLKKMPLENASKFSVYTTFISLAVEGLSLADGTNKQCSLQMYGINMSLLISVHGKIAKRVRDGILLRCIPTIIYDEDHFEPTFVDDCKIKLAEGAYKPNLRRKTNKLLACVIRLDYPDRKSDMILFQIKQMERLKNSSEKKNNGKANELYTSNDGQPDEGFFTTKALNFALKYLADKVKVKTPSFVTEDGEFIPLTVREESLEDETVEETTTEVEKEVQKHEEAIEKGGVKIETKNGELF